MSDEPKPNNPVTPVLASLNAMLERGTTVTLSMDERGCGYVQMDWRNHTYRVSSEGPIENAIREAWKVWLSPEFQTTD